MRTASLPRAAWPALLVIQIGVAATLAASCGSTGNSSSGTGSGTGGTGSPTSSGSHTGGSHASSAQSSGTGGSGTLSSGTLSSGTQSSSTQSSGTGGSMGVDTNYPCTGCNTFPPAGAPACGSGVLDPVTIAYPLDGLLLPPNMNVLEVQFVPPSQATSSTLYEVDFSNAITTVKVETQCNAITPVRGGPSPGCGVTLPQQAWNDIANTNRDGDPVKVTVRATNNGQCVSTSTASISINFAKDDVTGGIYYWQSATYGGIGGTTGGIYSHDFGTFDPTPTPFYTSGATGTCVGCHFLSRDGVRMSLAYDDPDGDDEFGDMHTTVLDVASRSVIGGKSMSPGFQTWTHNHSAMIASTYKTAMNKSFGVFDSNGQTLVGTDALPTGTLGTQESLSADDSTLVFVVPTTTMGYGISMAGDTHFFGGSLYLASYDAATHALGTPSLLIQSTGTAPSATNFYYPDIAADNSFVVFNEAPSGDAFYNVNARVKLLHLPAVANAQPLDMPALNVADGLTNSWPRFSPVVQTYKGHKILWVTFSSNRDYGLHLTNKGFNNCYPPESPSYDQPQPLSKQGVTYQDCAQPQIWMAGVIVDPDPSLDSKDRSFPAFWLPFQDVTSHNHSPQWVQQIQGGMTPDGGAPDGGSSTSSSGTTSTSTSSTGSSSSGGPTCGGQNAACGGGAPLCCTDMVCCGVTCQPVCAQ